MRGGAGRTTGRQVQCDSQAIPKEWLVVQKRTEFANVSINATSMLRDETESDDTLLARIMNELARPHVVKSARTTMTRLEFEAKPEWRATIRRRRHLVFILEGQGRLAGKFYEYPDDWICRDGFGQPLEVEMDESGLRHQLANGQIELLSGAVPHLARPSD